MLKLPRNRDVEVELETGELEVVASPGRYTAVDRGSSLGRPRRAGQSSAPPPAHRSAPPAAFRSAPPAAYASHASHAPQAPHGYVNQAPQQVFAPQPAQTYAQHPSYAPPPPVPWAPAAVMGYAPAYASAQYPAQYIPPAPSSFAAVADPTSQHPAILSASATRGRSTGPSGMVWAATLVVMGAFLGAMYGVYMRAPVPQAAQAGQPMGQAVAAAAQPVQMAAQPAAPVVAVPVAIPAAPPPAVSLVGVVGPASPVMLPGKSVEEPVAAAPKGGKAANKHDSKHGAVAPHHGGTASVAAAVPVPHGTSKAPAAPPSSPRPKGGKTAEEIAAEKTLQDARNQPSL